MKKLLVLFICLSGAMANATTPKAKPTACIVKTYDQAGVYLATVLTADGLPLSLAAAATTTQLLNDRHNNGDNPVVARYTCT